MSGDVGLRVTCAGFAGASLAFRLSHHLGPELAEVGTNITMGAMIIFLILIQRRARTHQA